MWQPINTVPKNKTIDLWYKNLGRVSECIFYQDSWQTRIWDGSFRVISVEEPTHWMDIPEDPKKEVITHWMDIPEDPKKEVIKQQDQVIDEELEHYKLYMCY